MTTGHSSEFLNSVDIGRSVASKTDLEVLSNGLYMREDGSTRLRADINGGLSAILPLGVFTSTSRTLAAAPAAACIAASPLNVVASAVAGTTAMQYTTNISSWIQTSLVTPASTQVNSLIWAGSRFIAGVSGSAQPLVTTGDNPGSTWTVTTGATTTTLTQGLAYSASLGLTVMVTDGASTSCYTLADAATAWSTRTKTSSTPVAVVWTGTYFVIFTTTVGLIQYSADGTTWTDMYVTFSGAGQLGADWWQAGNGFASDGAGTIVTSVFNSNNGFLNCYFAVSNDHGANWSVIPIPYETSRAVATLPKVTKVQYLNAKFIAHVASSGAVNATGWILGSKTGKYWALEPVGQRGIADTAFKALTYFSSTYVGINTATTAALSASEASTNFRIPATIYGNPNSTAGLLPGDQMYMRVK